MTAKKAIKKAFKMQIDQMGFFVRPKYCPPAAVNWGMNAVEGAQARYRGNDSVFSARRFQGTNTCGLY